MIFSDWLRKTFKGVIDSIAKIFCRLGITANQITVFGLLGNIVASGFIATGHFLAAGIITIFTVPLDVLDGAIARESNKNTSYGALLDSVCDRYSEMLLIFGVFLYFLSVNNILGVIIAFCALCGSFLVSYVRARAEGLGVVVKEGILTRVERSIILIFSLLISRPLYGAIVIAILGNITAIQRLCIAHKLLINEGKKDK